MYVHPFFLLEGFARCCTKLIYHLTGAKVPMAYDVETNKKNGDSEHHE